MLTKLPCTGSHVTSVKPNNVGLCVRGADIVGRHCRSVCRQNDESKQDVTKNNDRHCRPIITGRVSRRGHCLLEAIVNDPLSIPTVAWQLRTDIVDFTHLVGGCKPVRMRVTAPAVTSCISNAQACYQAHQLKQQPTGSLTATSD